MTRASKAQAERLAVFWGMGANVRFTTAISRKSRTLIKRGWLVPKGGAADEYVVSAAGIEALRKYLAKEPTP